MSEAPTLNSDTTAAILETVREEYFAQERRHGLVISKTQTLSTVATIIFTAISACFITTTNLDFNRCWMLAALISVTVGIALCLGVLVSRTFEKILYEPTLNDSEMSKAPAVVMGNLAKTYDEAIARSAKTVTRLVHTFDFAVGFLLLSLLLAGVSLFTAPKKEAVMSQENTNTQTSQPAEPKPSQTTSYGTAPEKRSGEAPAAPKTSSYGTKAIKNNGDE